MKKHIILISLAMFLGILGYAQSPNQSDISVTTIVKKIKVITNESGSKESTLVAVDKVVPGDEVVYIINVRNTGDKPAEKVNVVNPIPEHCTFITSKTFGKGTLVEFSIDEGKSFSKAEDLNIPISDESMRLATAKDYTHIRWTFESALEANSESFVGFHTFID